MSEEKFEQVFQVSAPAKLVVKNMRGSVDIQPGQDGTIQVTAVKHTDSGDDKRTEIELTQDSDGTVNAVARFPEGAVDWLFGSRPCKVDFVIQAPRQCSLNLSGVSNDSAISGLEGEFSLRSVSGDLNLHDLTGDLNIHTVSGDVELEGFEGKLYVHTVSGEVDGSNVSGHADLDTVSGDISMKKASLPAVEAKSVSGDFELQTTLEAGPYHFHTVSGEVRLTVPAETHCSAELHSISGRISTSLPQSESSRDHGRHLVEVQGGGVKVFLHSVSGDLSLVS